MGMSLKSQTQTAQIEERAEELDLSTSCLTFQDIFKTVYADNIIPLIIVPFTFPSRR